MKRGMILAAVMLLVALGALTSVGVLFRSSAEQFTVSASGKSARARAMARSGLAGVMRELEIQRLDILSGADPVLLEELTLEQPDGRIGVARIIRVRGEAARPEGVKINVNHASAETLGRLALVGPDLAGRIVDARPFASIDDLLRVDGVTPELLYGDMRALLAEDESSESELIGDASLLALRDVLTVHGFWPPIQLGAGESGARFAGEQRINLNTPWSEDLGRAIARRYSEDIANGVRTIMERGVKFSAERDIVNILIQLGSEPSDWPEVLDSFCVSDEPALPGRVDLARAPAEILAALPGLDETGAAAITAARPTVDRSAWLTPVWPVTCGAIRDRTLAACIDSLAPSSAQWRVVIEAGFLPPGAEDSDEDAELSNRVVLEAVVDLSAPRARLAELTDITDLGLSIAWRLERDPADTSTGEPEQPDEGPSADDVGDTLEPGLGAPRETDEPMDPDTDNAGDEPETAPPPDRRIGRFRVRAGGGGDS